MSELDRLQEFQPVNYMGGVGLTSFSSIVSILLNERTLANRQLKRTLAALRRQEILANANVCVYPLPEFEIVPDPIAEYLMEDAWATLVARSQATGSLQEFRIKHLRETIERLKQRLRLLNLAIRLLLHALAESESPFQLIRRERAWSLLHGSHPPRNHAVKMQTWMNGFREGIFSSGLLAA